jgi:hypothetical protein
MCSGAGINPKTQPKLFGRHNLFASHLFYLHPAKGSLCLNRGPATDDFLANYRSASAATYPGANGHERTFQQIATVRT